MNNIQMRAFRDELCKIAEVKPELTPEAKPPPTISGTVAKGLAGLVLGTAAGYGLGRGIEAVTGKNVHRYVQPIAMAAGTVLPIAHQLWKGYEAEELRKAHEHNQSVAALGKQLNKQKPTWEKDAAARNGVFKKFVNTLSGKNVERAKRVVGTLDKKVEDADAMYTGAMEQSNKLHASHVRRRLSWPPPSDADVSLALERSRKMEESNNVLTSAADKFVNAKRRLRRVHGIVRDAEKNTAQARVGTGAVAAVGVLGGGYHVLGRMADAADRRDAERSKADRSGVK